MLRITFYLLFVFCPLLFFGQKNNNETEAENWKTLTDSEIAYVEDTTRKLPFSAVLKKEFTPGQTADFNLQSVYWYRFSLSNKKDKKRLFLHLRMVDYSNVYIPVKGPESYKNYNVGFFAKRKESIVQYDQLHTLNLETENIDFSRPFYFNKRIVTNWSKINKAYLPGFIFANSDISLNQYLLQLHYNHSEVLFYIGIVFISFFLFLVSFFISKNKSYLIYGLYLMGVVLYYGNRQPLFLNVYYNTIPELHFYINQLTNIANMGFYIWFVFYFLDFKYAFPKAYKFTRGLLLGILAFGVLHGLQILLFPYFSYRFLVMDVFRLVVMVISVGLFVFLMFQKPDTIAKIVLIGSLVLITGNVMSIILTDYTIFLRLMIVEIILFSLVVSIRNKQIDNRRIKNRYALEVEKMKIKTVEELEATKTRFYENITHEFRTPLTLILSPIEKKLANTSLPLEEKKELNLMQRNAKRLLVLVSQMLDLAKLEEGNIKLSVKKGDLKTFLQQTVSVYKQEASSKTITFTQNIHDIKSAWFDQNIIEKVTTNLLSNALKYTPKNGTIHLKSYTENGYWILVITNTTNPAISIDVSKLFTRYYRADEHTEGTGIGLNITKELVELAHGNIVANTLQNNDMQFTVSLPIEQSFFTESPVEHKTPKNETATKLSKTNTNKQDKITTTETESSTVESNPKNTDSPKLLVVEDNPDMREFIVSNFIDDYQILEAENGKVGIEQAQKYLPDLIISDVMMPVKNGFELCDAIKQNTLTSHIPVILLTAKVGEESEIQGFKTGADAYITKPFSTEKLKARTLQLINAQKRLAEHYKNSFSINPDLAITDTETEFLKLLKSVLDKHITDANFNTDRFSQLMQMSRRQLHRKLKAIIGMTPTEFVRNQRVKLATELLKKSDATVSEIAYQVGFNTPSYFIKCFKEAYGYTPSEFSENS